MKKILSAVLVVILVLVFQMPVHANITQATEEGLGTATLNYSVASGYTIIIPDSITISGASATIEISAEGVKINEGMKLSLRITNAQNRIEGTSFRLVADTSNFLPYSVKLGEATKTLDDEILAVNAGTATGSCTLTVTPNVATKSGEYRDTLTFTAAVVTQ